MAKQANLLETLPSNLLARKEVHAWMMAFVDEDVEQVGAPKTRDDVFVDLFEIWAQKGFVDANTLKKELSLKYLNGDRRVHEVIETIHDFGRGRDIDEFSGGLRKTYLEETTGLAHLYAHQKGVERPVGIIELDFSNMGGTNIFFKQLIAESQGIDVSRVPDEAAENYTDRCAKILTDEIRNTLRKTTGRDDAICIRAGGDELRFLLPDVTEYKYDTLIGLIHETVENTTARLGLHDHPHHKDQDNPYKEGFGLAIDIRDLRSFEENYEELNKMERQIKYHKVELGYARKGEICKAYLEDSFNEKADSRNVYGELREALWERVIDDASKAAKKRYENYQELKKEAGPDVPPTQRLEAIEKEMLRLEEKGSFARAAHGQNVTLVSNELHTTLQQGGEKRVLFESPEERYINAIETYLAENNLLLTKYESRVLSHVMSTLSPMDPVTKTWLDRDMPEATEIYMNDAQYALTELDASKVQKLMREEGYASEEFDNMQAQGMRVAFHNLAGLNREIGQSGANKVLEHWSRDIIEESMKDFGLIKGDHYEIAHYGGGEFQMIIRPIADVEEWGLTLIDEDVLRGVSNRINDRVQHLNNTNISEFLEKSEASVSVLDRTLTFADVEDPKKGREVWGRGMNASVIYGALEPTTGTTKTPGGSALYRQKKSLEKTVEIDRAIIKKEWQASNDECSGENEKGNNTWEKLGIS